MKKKGNKIEHIEFLSVVIPSYKQEKTIIKDIKKINFTLSTLQIPFEIIVIVDGFIDGAYKKLKRLKNQGIHVYGYKENKGKGYAVRYGFSKAKGDVIGFMDSGMDLDPTGISMLLNHMNWYKADVIIGSKLHPVSQVNYPYERKILSWGYRTLTHLLFGFKVRDTQVGLKFFRKKVVDAVFPRLKEKGFAFDVEVLALAYSLGYKKIYEAPVKLNFRQGSITSKKLIYTILGMLVDTLAIYYRIKIKRSYKKSNRKKWLGI